MSKQSFTTETGVAATKLAAGPGIAFLGVLTLSDIATIAGIFTSLIIGLYQIWKWWCDWSDRKRRLAAQVAPQPQVRTPQDE